ncbi:MAG: hypothetical protein QM820_62000 [Minicystis sp.]
MGLGLLTHSSARSPLTSTLAIVFRAFGGGALEGAALHAGAFDARPPGAAALGARALGGGASAGGVAQAARLAVRQSKIQEALFISIVEGAVYAENDARTRRMGPGRG